MGLFRSGSSGGSNDLATKYVHSLVLHEKAIAALYDAFTKAVPKDADFWRGLADEERIHADVLGQLKQMFDDGLVSSGRPEFLIDDVRRSVEYLGKHLEDVWANGIERRTAVKLALDIERALIESDYFAVFEEDDPQMRQEFEKVRKFTEEHLRRVESKFAELS